ncbi:unnamed protein product [Amoebophrya sp. A120]|nr:unnamed protein product [Amoebophrya sp. A120]|eukprot:GSA120T00018510001.1
MNLYFSFLAETYLCNSPVVAARALELVRPRSRDLAFPRPWSAAGMAIYHVISAILFTNAQRAGMEFLTRKGIQFAGGEENVMQETKKQKHKNDQEGNEKVQNSHKQKFNDYKRHRQTVSSPLSFRRHQCQGEENAHMWDVAKEYAYKSAGLRSHGYSSPFAWWTKAASDDVTKNLHRQLGPGALPVVVLGDVVLGEKMLTLTKSGMK